MVALALPMVSLMSLGVVWLWQSSFMIHWALGALALSITVYGFELWMMHGGKQSGRPNAQTSTTDGSDDQLSARTDTETGDETATSNLPDPSWTPIEQQAWQKVVAIARAVDPNTLSDRRAALDLGRRTIETVARTLHPDEQDPLLRFTVPEALALVERVSSELRPFVIDSIPLGDQITVAQAMQLYRWKSAAGLAGTAYDVWRLIRVMNPVTAATQEMREQVSKKLMGWGRDALARKLLQRYVEEVGRAAIELYGGRLALTTQELARQVSAASQADLKHTASQTAEPLRILVAGQIGVGKSSLVNALAKSRRAAVDVVPTGAQTKPYELVRDGFPTALLLDCEGLTETNSKQLVETATQCDMILYVVDATRVDRQLDRQFLQAVADRFAVMVDRRPPPVVVALSMIDRLRPFNEWSPPYDLNDSNSESGGAVKDTKARSIMIAREAVAKDIATVGLGLCASDIIPLCLDKSPREYNIDALWFGIEAALDDARNAQLVRRLVDAGTNGLSLKKLMSQARGASSVVARTLRR